MSICHSLSAVLRKILRLLAFYLRLEAGSTIVESNKSTTRMEYLSSIDTAFTSSMRSTEKHTSENCQERPRKLARVTLDCEVCCTKDDSPPAVTRHFSYLMRTTNEHIRNALLGKPSDYMTQLPAELLVNILSHLSVPDLKRAELICKHFRGTIINPKNVDTFLLARQHAAEARLYEKLVRLTLRGFVNQNDSDFLDALTNFTNRGGMSGGKSRCLYITAAMVDLFNLNLKTLAPQANEHTSNAKLTRAMQIFAHYLLQVHINKHMPSAAVVACSVCAELSIDEFMQDVERNCSKLEPYGFTKTRILHWYHQLWNPVIECGGDWADGVLTVGPPLLEAVEWVSQPPEHLVTHLMWHESGTGAKWGIVDGAVRQGLCSMSRLATLFDVPGLPEKTNFRDIGNFGLLSPLPISDCSVPAYFFAYYVKRVWARDLVSRAVRGTVAIDNFVKTAIMEELDIY